MLRNHPYAGPASPSMKIPLYTYIFSYNLVGVRLQGAALVAVRYLLVEYLFFTDGHKGRTLQADNLPKKWLHHIEFSNRQVNN